MAQKQEVDTQSGIIEVFDQKYFLDKRKATPSGATGRIGTKEARPGCAR
jgi:outer membrane receptor for Fe3+-dicitrate